MVPMRGFRVRGARRGPRPSDGVYFSTGDGFVTGETGGTKRGGLSRRKSAADYTFSAVEEGFKAGRRANRPGDIAVGVAIALPVFTLALGVILAIEHHESTSSDTTETPKAVTAPTQAPTIRLGDCLGSEPGDAGFPGTPISCALLHTAQVVGLFTSATDAFTACDGVPLAHPGVGNVEVTMFDQGAQKDGQTVACVLVSDPVQGSQMGA
jgi:hypothetical protein